jgi:hypothetical protein
MDIQIDIAQHMKIAKPFVDPVHADNDFIAILFFQFRIIRHILPPIPDKPF